MKDLRHHLKIKIKHLAAEARIIRHEERKHHGMHKWDLQHHRKTIVRENARQAQLAYAFIRGREFGRVAPHYSLTRFQQILDREAVIRMVRKYGPVTGADMAKAVEAWMETRRQERKAA